MFDVAVIPFRHMTVGLAQRRLESVFRLHHSLYHRPVHWTAGCTDVFGSSL